MYCGIVFTLLRKENKDDNINNESSKQKTKGANQN